jgi:ATP synthase protein I
VSPEKPDDKGVKGNWGSALREAGPYLGIGTTIAASLGLGLWLGFWLDGKFGTSPLYFLLGGGLGLTAAFYHLFKLVKGQKP